MRELIETFRPASAEMLAQREFEEARRELLKAGSAKEYAEALVTYHQARVSRLEGFLRKANRNGA